MAGVRRPHQAAIVLSRASHCVMDEAEFRDLLKGTRKFPQHLWNDVQRLENGNPAGVGSVAKFLEADPWFFRSGYLKADLIKLLNRVEIPPVYADRLRKVIINVVEKRDRREFRSYCRLAKRLDNPKLREELAKRLEDKDPSVRRRARWVLEACEGTK